MNKKVNVLHILDSIRYSGIEVMLHDASDFFKKNGLESTILSTGDTIGDYYPVLKEDGYKIDFIPYKFSLKYVIKLGRYLRRNHFDIIHMYREKAYFFNVLLLRFFTNNIRIVRTYCDVFYRYKFYIRLLRHFQRFLSRKAFNVKGIAIGKSVKEVERIYFKNPTTIIPDWINEENFRPATNEERNSARKEFGIENNKFVLLTVGTCNSKKRHKDIFDAIARIKIQVPNILLLHRGTGPNKEKEVEYVSKNRIEDNVNFIGYIDFLPKLFWAADVFILASKWEGLGNVIIEAIACGLPVILYNGWGMKDFIPPKDSNYGFWIDPEKETFDKYILNINSQSQVERETFSKNAVKYFKNNFSMNGSMMKFLKVYKG